MIDLEDSLATDILSLGMQADEARRALGGDVVTYMRVHVVTVADLTRGLTVPDEAAEVRLYELPSTLAEAVAAIGALRSAAGARRVAAFSMAQLEERAQTGWGSVPEVIRQLAAAGLSDVAELPADRVADLLRSVQLLTDAGLPPQRVTVSHPLGDDRLPLLGVVRAAVARYPSLRRFAPLPRIAPVDKPTTGYDDVRMVAMARLAFSEPQPGRASISIEVDWSLYGPKLAQVALTFGADHLDAVAATSDTALGHRRSTVEDVERNIRAAGFVPQEYRPKA
ncbi:MAG TPA: hypothetical protein VNJ02_09965 [Vicinamibacterales bacterium]|nr:hypothetical protein [Vicinamibacterales bacterium]